MTVTPVEMSSLVKTHVYRLGGGFMLSDEAKEAASSLGLGGWAFYHLGRGGVLGDVHPDVVAAAFHFFPPTSVHKGWTKARAVLTPDEAVSRFAGVCQAWGRRHLAEAKDLDRLAELLAKAADAAPVAGAPVFAGWRAVPLPDDAPARVAQLSHVLREYRGGVHGMCCIASGLTPVQSVLLAGGDGNAKFFGWPEPYEDVSALAPRRTATEELTDVCAAEPWAALDDDERDELVPLLTAASEAALASLNG